MTFEFERTKDGRFRLYADGEDLGCFSNLIEASEKVEQIKKDESHSRNNGDQTIEVK